MSFADDIEAFLGMLRFERSMAENTVLAYSRDLAIFAAWATARGKTQSGDMSREEIVAFLQEERIEGRKGTTRARRTAALRQFYHFLRERRRIAHDPTELLDPPKKAQPLPRILTEQEVFAMLDEIKGDDPRNLRDRALLETMYGCGLRVSEACGLDLADIVADGELVRIVGKGSKERVVPLGSAAGRAINAYLEKSRPHFVQGRTADTHLFVTRLGKAFTRQGIFKIIRQRAAAVGIAAERISPHVLRHCFASHMLQHGADIRAIQELLGHADIGTTQIYTHVDTAKFGEVHRKYHPRAL